MFTVTQGDFDAWVRHARLGTPASRLTAVIVLQRHPTGWFAHTVQRACSPAEAVIVRQLVSAHVYAAFVEGEPGEGWRQGDDGRWTRLVRREETALSLPARSAGGDAPLASAR